MKKQVLKEISRVAPVTLAVVASIISIVGLSIEINYMKSMEWVVGVLGALSGAVVVFFFVRIQKALNAPKVFISYAHEDFETVSKICKSLEDYTVEVLIDKHELKVGDNINKKISEMVDASDYFIFVNSKNNANSDWATKELQKAMQQGKKILPVQLDDSNMPELISGLVFADFGVSFENGINQIGSALRHNKKMQPTQKTRG